MEHILKRANRQSVEKLITAERISYEEAERYIKNPENFAKRIESLDRELVPGLSISQKTIELGGGHFTNMYDLKLDHDTSGTANIITGNSLFYQHRLFHPKNRHAIKHGLPVASINGAFFFLQDGPLEKEPSEIMYNLNIRDGDILGLPAVNRGAVIVDLEGKLHATDLIAKGTIDINGASIAWVGGEPLAHKHKEIHVYDNEAVLFNSACCTIQYENSGDKRSLRRLQTDLNTTPQDVSVVDVVVSFNESCGNLEVTQLNKGGGTNFFEGNFILQLQHNAAKDINIGSIVHPKTVGSIDLSNIQAAMTVGPSVSHFLTHNDHEINHDQSLGSFPPFAQDQRYARSIAYEDTDESLHFVVFDAVPHSSHMKGVTPHEAAVHIPKDAPWSIFLDGGQSSRITYTDPEAEGGISAHGNTQYLRLHERYKDTQGSLQKGKEEQYLWSGSGRPVPAALTLHMTRK